MRQNASVVRSRGIVLACQPNSTSVYHVRCLPIIVVQSCDSQPATRGSPDPTQPRAQQPDDIIAEPQPCPVSQQQRGGRFSESGRTSSAPLLEPLHDHRRYRKLRDLSRCAVHFQSGE